MAVSDKTPLTFDLPDGDRVVLCTWPYVVSKLEELIEPLTKSVTSMNSSLGVIEDKIDTWLEDKNS